MVKTLPKINILLTFDYELPLGGVAKSFEDSLFGPAGKLLDFAGKMNVPVVFFADILSYIRFKEFGLDDYTGGFREQLQQAIVKRNDVQLHLHPHWLDTKIEKGRFYPSDKFKLADFYNNRYPDNIPGIVKRGVEELTAVCSPASAGYRCIAYRGGGYNLEPRTGEIVSALFDNGVKFDSTVVPGYFFVSRQNIVDFRKVPQKPNWFISPDGDFKNPGSNGLWEIPIAGKPKSLFEIPTALKMKKYSHRAPEHRGSIIHKDAELNLRDKLKMFLSSRMLTVDNYTYSQKYLRQIFDHHIRKYNQYDEVSLALIGHPKSMGDYSFELLEDFIRYVREVYGSNARFTNFTELEVCMNSNAGK